MNAIERWMDELSKALLEIDGLDVSECVRKTLRRACAECLVESEDRALDGYERRNEGERWTAGDSAELARMLGEVAGAPKNWSEEGMRVQQLALHFGRSRKYVRKRAIEIGLGAKLDYFGGLPETQHK